jgi:hypothetical protein
MSIVKRMRAGAALGMAVIGSGLFAASAKAGYVVTLKQEGGDVVASGSGAIDLAGLTRQDGPFLTPPQVIPITGVILTGPLPVAASPILHEYSGLTGPDNFGTGLATLANSGSGVLLGEGGGFLIVQDSYVSGSFLSDSAAYDGQSLSSLGVTSGVYEWTWGRGSNQSFTLEIGVPEPSSLLLLSVGFVGLLLAPVGRRLTAEGSAIARSCGALNRGNSAFCAGDRCS